MWSVKLGQKLEISKPLTLKHERAHRKTSGFCNLKNKKIVNKFA